MTQFGSVLPRRSTFMKLVVRSIVEVVFHCYFFLLCCCFGFCSLLGLLANVSMSDQALINYQMLVGLEKVRQLLLIVCFFALVEFVSCLFV